MGDYGEIQSLLEQARACRFCRPELRDLGSRLPQDGGILDDALVEARTGRDEIAFTNLLFAALAAGRQVEARHLVEGAALLPGPDILVAAALHCSGDVAGALLDAVRVGHLSQEMESAALLAAACWARERQSGEVPPSLLPRARKLAQLGWLNPSAQMILQVLEHECHDPQLRAAACGPLEPPRDLVAGFHHALVVCSRASALAFVPDEPPPSGGMGITIRRAAPRVGRNEPCPCGSGKKHKKCCWEKAQERRRHSSEVPGVTVEELRANPEEHLTSARLFAMGTHELARLDPTRVKPALQPYLASRLNSVGEREAVLSLFRRVGVRDDLFGHWEDALDIAAAAGDVTAVRSLLNVANREPTDPTLPLAPYLLVNLADPLAAGPLLTRIEDEARAVADGKQPELLVDLACDLLDAGLSGLGILAARSALPLAVDLDRWTLLEHLADERDSLGLAGEDPVVEILRQLGAEEDEEASDETPELTAAQSALQVKSTEVRTLRIELDGLRRKVEELANRPPQSRVAPAPRASDGPSLQDLRTKLDSLKGELDQRHRERNQLRRELTRAREELNERSAAEQPAAATVRREPDDDLPEDDGLPVQQPLRLPVFPERFRDVLERLPAPVARRGLRIIGSLCAGDPATFRGAKHLTGHREYWRVRVGISHRILFRLNDDTLEVLAFVTRENLEKTVKSL